MSDLTPVEKRKLEQFFGMRDGFVMNFSNREFADFVRECTTLDIYDSRYADGGTSKANRLRTLWRKEPNNVVGKLMKNMLEASN